MKDCCQFLVFIILWHFPWFIFGLAFFSASLKILNEAILVLVRTVSTEFVAKAPDLASTLCLLSLVVGMPGDWLGAKGTWKTAKDQSKEWREEEKEKLVSRNNQGIIDKWVKVAQLFLHTTVCGCDGVGKVWIEMLIYFRSRGLMLLVLPVLSGFLSC